MAISRQLSMFVIAAAVTLVMQPAVAVEHVVQARQIIEQKLEFYERAYPQIRFVHAEGGAGWRREMRELLLMMGDGAAPLDFQYPPDVSAEMLTVSIDRLRHVLRDDVVSATTFSVSEGTAAEPPNLCIVTLNPAMFVADDLDSLQYMLELSDEELRRVHPSRYLNWKDHLVFALDHEASHCIDSVVNGGAPITHHKFGGQYNEFRRESLADAYALAVHISSNGAITDYARNITHIRALCLVTEGPRHCTFESMRQVMLRDPVRLQGMTLPELMSFAVLVRDQAVGSYDAYVGKCAAATQAVIAFGRVPDSHGEFHGVLDDAEVDRDRVSHLMQRYSYFYGQLFNDSPVIFAPVEVSGD